MADQGRRGRAVLFRKHGGPEVLEYVTDFAFPALPEGQLLVRTVSAGVNPIDIHFRGGFMGTLQEFPVILGGELAGIVEVAPAGSKFKVGDKIFALTTYSFPRPGVYGTNAEFVAVKEEWLAPAPENFPHVDAGSVPVVALTAWQALLSANPKPSQRILILAASGGVGHLAVQFAKLRGLYVVGTAGTSNLEMVRGLGADEVVDYSEGAAALRARFASSDATKFDILLDLVGGEALEVVAAELLRPGAAIAHVVNSGLDAAGRERREKASADGTGPKWTTIFVKSNAEQLAEIGQLLGSGKVRLNVSHRLPLEEAAKAHGIVGGKHAGGKVILTF